MLHSTNVLCRNIQCLGDQVTRVTRPENPTAMENGSMCLSDNSDKEEYETLGYLSRERNSSLSLSLCGWSIFT